MKRIALLLLLLLLAFAPSARAVVYAPGLAQAQFDGASTDKTSDIAVAANRTHAAGPIMANTSGSAKDWNGTSWSWSGNRVFGYIGEMWMEAGTTYTFGKSVDDWTYIVVDGTTLIDNSTWNAINFGSFTATKTGWVPIEVRVGNGGGAAVESLPHLHEDPFDRILLAQARAEGCALLTADSVLPNYGEPVRKV